MSDRRLRELERRWRETGLAEAEAAYFRERLRAGLDVPERPSAPDAPAKPDTSPQTGWLLGPSGPGWTEAVKSTCLLPGRFTIGRPGLLDRLTACLHGPRTITGTGLILRCDAPLLRSLFAQERVLDALRALLDLPGFAAAQVRGDRRTIVATRRCDTPEELKAINQAHVDAALHAIANLANALAGTS